MANMVPTDSVSLRDLLIDISKLRATLIGIVVFCSAAGVVAGALGTRQFDATIELTPTESNGATGTLGSLGAVASQYGGLATLAGLSLPGSDRVGEIVTFLQSELLTETYIRDNNLMPELFWKEWDKNAHEWRRGLKSAPTLWQANRLFASSIRTVTENSKTGIIEMRIRWKDPKLAAAWANGLVTAANAYLRDNAIREAERNIAYLKEQAASTNLVEMQRAIDSLLEQQLNQEMLARGREQYALTVVDPAFSPEKSSSGGPVLLGVLGFALGLFISIVVVFLRRLWQLI